MRTLAIALLLVLPSLSQAYDSQNPMNLQPYVDFAAEWTSYEQGDHELPEVKSIPHEWVQLYAYGDYAVAQAEFNGEVLHPVNAVYLPVEKTIFLSDRLDTSDVNQVGPALVHESVHFLQDIAGYTASLEGRLSCTESEAYDVQMLWQLEHGIQIENIQFIQERSLLEAMQCMGNQFQALKAVAEGQGFQ